MSLIAPSLQAYFTDRLIRERRVSPHTIRSYRDTIRLLVGFAAQRAGTAASRLTFADLDSKTVSAFLDHLEQRRGCTPGTRNARLAAIRSFYRYAALEHPEHAATIERVLAIPLKRTDRPLVTWLTKPELDALLAAPDPSTWTGRRDHAMILLAAQTGLRASELTNVRIADLTLGTGAHVQTLGKGRRERVTPLTDRTVTTLRAWLKERGGMPADPLFPTRTGGMLTRDALARRLTKYATIAAATCPSLASKTITPHALRHTAAMRLLHAKIDTSVIALWLGHAEIQTTQIYLNADLALKEEALAKAEPIDSKPGRYRPPDPLLRFLESL
ncbi:MAG: tyrosine-type recombinase/integrase [Solirubrobacteraceae bacterium]